MPRKRKEEKIEKKKKAADKAEKQWEEKHQGENQKIFKAKVPFPAEEKIVEKGEK